MSLKKKTLKKAISTITTITTIVWLSGMSMFAISANVIADERPSVEVSGVTVYDGDLISSNATNDDGTPTYASLDIYISKVVGTKLFKRLVLNPTVFDSYGHLNWGDVREVDQAVVDGATTSSLVRPDEGDKVFALVADDDSGSKSWVNLTAEDFTGATGTDIDSIYTINSTDKDSYTVVGDIETATQLETFYTSGTLPDLTPVPAGILTASLSSDTPIAGYVSKGVQNALYVKANLTTEGVTTVSKVVVQRKGLGYDSDITTVRLYDGATQVGTDQSLNTTTHKVTFNNINWELAAGTTTLSVKANTYSSATGTNTYFEIIEIESDATSVTGLPVAGNAMQFSALSVGQLDATSVSGTQDVISGETNIELGCWNFAASSTEGFYLDSIKLTNTGSSSSTESKNFVLKQSATELAGSSVAEMASDGIVTFDMSASPYFIDKSTTKKICVYGDITAGITVAKTLIFQIAEAKHVIARGDSSAGEVLVTYSGGTAFASQTAKTSNIQQGDATLAQNAGYAPTSGTAFVKGVPDNKMAAYKLTAGSNEGVKLTKLTAVLAGTNVVNTDFSNWKIYKIVGGAEVEIPVSGSISGLNVTFEDTTTGLVSVAKSENETVVIRADVTTSVGGDETGAHVYVGADGTTNTVARIKGLASGDYITSGVTLSGVATGDAQTFTVGSNGALVVSKSASSPAPTTLAKGGTKLYFTTINLYATGEDINVTDIDLTSYETSAQTDVTDSGEISNIYITDESGTQLGSTVSAPSTGVSSFSFSYTVPKETNKALKVYGDIPSGSGASYLHVDMKTANTDITSTGVYSGTTLTETGTAQGSTMTVGAPTVVAAMATSPIASTYVINTPGVTIGKLVLTETNTSEDVKITSIKISADDASTIDGTSSADTLLTNVKLIDANDGITQYGITQNLTTGTPDYATFSGINNLTVSKGGVKNINIVADVKGNTGTYYLGVLDASTTVTGTGISSNASATVTPSTAVASAGATMTTVGLLKVNKAADMPAASQLVSGTTGVELMKYKFEASYEDIDITTLPLYYTGTVADIANVKLYLDGTQIGATSGYVFTAALNTVNLTTGTFVVPKDSSAVLTIKADINPKAQVTTSTTSIYIGIVDEDDDNSDWDSAGSYNITAAGVSSGATVTATNIDSLGTGGGNVYGSSAFTLHKGILTVSLNSGSPSGSKVGGTNKPLAYIDFTATGDDIYLNGVEFCYGGVAGNATGGSLVLKDSAGTTTYGTITATEFDQYWDDIGGDGVDADASIPLKTGVDSAEQCFSWGKTGQMTIYNQTTHAEDSITDIMDAFDTNIEISAGTTKTVKLYGDTTGFTTNDSLQITIQPNATAANKATTSGIEYEDSSGTDIDLTTTKNLPLNGGSLTY